MAPCTEFAHNFCAWIGPMQLGIVLVLNPFIYLAVNKDGILDRWLKEKK